MCRDTELMKIEFTCPLCGRVTEKELLLPPELMKPFGGRLTANCAECGKRREEAERAEKEAFETRRRAEEARIPPEFRVWDRRLGNHSLASWIRENRENNLLIIGDFEIGKTRAAACNLLLEARSGKRCRFYDFPELSKEYAKELQQSMLSAIDFQVRLLSLDILLIDDLAKRRINDTAGELVYDLVNKVYEGARVRLWLTSNHDTRELVGKFSNLDTGGAVLSRIDRMADEGRFKIWKGKRS